MPRIHKSWFHQKREMHLYAMIRYSLRPPRKIGLHHQFHSKSTFLIRVLRIRERTFEKVRKHYPHYENEQLCEINIDLKKGINELRLENRKLKAKLMKRDVM